MATKLDNRLLRALNEGPGALPDDLYRLADYLRLIQELLEEKASEREATWALARAAAAEIETLQSLEIAVADRAIALPAQDLPAVLAKLAIWRVLAGGACDTEEIAPGDRMIRSVEADLARLAKDQA